MEGFEELEDYLDETTGPVDPAEKLKRGYEKTRFVRGGMQGGHSFRARDDLRPAPLQTTGMSFLDIMNEDPPANSTPVPESNATENKSSTLKKQGLKTKKSLVNFRRIFSRKQNSTEEVPDANELKEGAKEQPTLSGSGQTHPLTPRGTSSSLSSADSRVFNEGPDEQKSPIIDFREARMTPPQVPDTSSSSVTPFLQTQLKEKMSFSSGGQMSVMTPLESPQAISSRYASPMPSPRKISLPTTPIVQTLPDKVVHQSPSAATRPSIPHRITGAHLSLESFPPVPKEDIAQLPKDLEPNVPAGVVSPFEIRRPSLPTLATASIADAAKSSGGFSRHPLPNLKIGRNGKVKKYDRNDPMMQAIDFRACEEIYGLEEAIARNVPASAFHRAPMKVEAAAKPSNDSIGLGIFADKSVQSATGSNVRAERGNSNETVGSPIYTPTTPRSGYLTPQSPNDYAEFYKNALRTSGKGKGESSPYGMKNQSYGDLTISPTLARINEGDTSAITSPFDDPSYIRSSDQSSALSYPTSALPSPSRKLFVDTHSAQGQSMESDITIKARSPPAKQQITTPITEQKSSLEKIQTCFRNCTPDEIRYARLGIHTEEDRLDVMNKLRKLTRTEVVKTQPASNRMEHPNHNRDFKSRNLWCVQHQGYCGSCKLACCVYEETIEAGKQAKDHYTKQLVSEVGKVILAASCFNEEPSTFLKCGECARFFCPECIGICPVDMCHFQVCKHCKSDNWEPCDWHNLI
ncbi:MAG: hypothetical protein Q9201_004494 [Fulgogasparrea decipioides]